MNTNYKVYKHTNKINKKVYVGISKNDLLTRWNNGKGYLKNQKFYSDIVKYGWDSFNHDIIFENLNYKDAVIKESELIRKYDSVEHGYNNAYSGYGAKYSSIDFFDFDPLDNKFYDFNNTCNYFTKIPNIFIRTNIKKTYGLNRIFLYVFITIDRNRSLENTSYICIGEVLRKCGYKTIQKNKPKIFFEVVKCLLFMKESNLIDVDIDIYDTGYEKCIPIRIIHENFDCTKDFTKIYGKQIDSILERETKLNKESLLTSFLYINSYIGCRSDSTKNPQEKPEAFWRSIDKMANELSMSKDTITQCIDCLTTSTDTNKSLLIKREVGSIQKDKNKPPQNVPNIYVLNKEGCEQEIEWALCKMLEIYEVDKFGEIIGNCRK